MFTCRNYAVYGTSRPVSIRPPALSGPWSACIRWAGAVLVALLGLLVTPCWAADTQWTRATLRGLPGVEVAH